MISPSRIYDFYLCEKNQSEIYPIDFNILEKIYENKNSDFEIFQDFIELRTQKIFLLSEKSIFFSEVEFFENIKNINKNERILFFKTKLLISFFYKFFITEILKITDKKGWDQISNPHLRKLKNFEISFEEMKLLGLTNSEIKLILRDFEEEENMDENTFEYKTQNTLEDLETNIKDLKEIRNFENLKKLYPFEFYLFKSKNISKIDIDMNSKLILNLFYIKEESFTRGVVMILSKKIYRKKISENLKNFEYYKKFQKISDIIQNNKNKLILFFNLINYSKELLVLQKEKKNLLLNSKIEKIVDFLKIHFLFYFKNIFDEYGGELDDKKIQLMKKDYENFKKIYNVQIITFMEIFEKFRIKLNLI